MTVEKFVLIVGTVFERIEKSPKLAFLVIFGRILAMFLRSQSYDFDTIAHIGRYPRSTLAVTVAASKSEAESSFMSN